MAAAAVVTADVAGVEIDTMTVATIGEEEEDTMIVAAMTGAATAAAAAVAAAVGALLAEGILPRCSQTGSPQRACRLSA